MSAQQAPPRSQPSRRDNPASTARGYLALTAGLYQDGQAVSAEILEFDVASWGRDFDEAYARIIEAAELVISSTYHDEPGGLERFLGEHQLIAHRRPPRTYRPAAIPSRLLSRQGLVLRPVSISIEAAIRD